jgi:hypothetical protein
VVLLALGGTLAHVVGVLACLVALVVHALSACLCGVIVEGTQDRGQLARWQRGRGQSRGWTHRLSGSTRPWGQRDSQAGLLKRRQHRLTASTRHPSAGVPLRACCWDKVLIAHLIDPRVGNREPCLPNAAL